TCGAPPHRAIRGPDRTAWHDLHFRGALPQHLRLGRDARPQVSDVEPSQLSAEAQVEALLFVADGPVEVARLGRALGVDRAALETAVASLAGTYAGRGVRLQRTGERVTLVSAPEAAEQIERFLGL